MKCPKWIKALLKHMKIGNVTDFENAEECDPNEPCRQMEPRKVKGVKFKFKF